MNIISGKYKGRKIEFSKKLTFRPTTGRVKEAVFSMLTCGKYRDCDFIENSIIIDLFAGSAAYSFESLSRGASRAIAVEIDSDNISIIRHNLRNIDMDANLTIIRGDATNLPKAKIKCDIAFIDPPYNSKLAYRCINSLKEQEWLGSNSLLIVETAINEKLSIPHDFTMIEQKEYSNTKITLLDYNEK